MANIKQTDKQLLELVLNKLESEEVFDYMDENNLLEPDQLYFVINNDERAIAEYDKDNNGIIDDSERLGGQLPEFYASQEDLVELKEDVLKSGTVNVDFGDAIVLNDGADKKPLYGLKLYGKTTQNGIPSPENPISLVSAGDDGDITVSISDESSVDIQTLTVSTPNGLRGIPITSGGNYTDENGQHWICDEIGFEQGVRRQRIGKLVMDGATNKFNVKSSSTATNMFSVPVEDMLLVNYTENTVVPLLCSHGAAVKHSSAYRGSVGAATYKGSVNSIRFSFGLNTEINTVEKANAWLTQQKNNGTPLMFWYVLSEFTETPLAAAEIAAYKALHTNKPVTTILNDGGAGMSIAYAPDNESAKALIDYIPRKTSDIENNSDFITTASVDDKIDKALDGYSNAVVTSNEGPNELDETTLLYIDFEAEPDTPYIDANFLLNGRALGENGEFTLDGSEIYITVNGIEEEAAVVTLPQGFDFLLGKINQVESNFSGVTNGLENTINEVQTRFEGNITTINDSIGQIETNITNLENNKVNRNGDNSLTGTYYLNGSINVIGEVKILEDMAYMPLITQKAVTNITGDNSSLITIDKTTLVSAINELKTQFDGLVNLDGVSF